MLITFLKKIFLAFLCAGCFFVYSCSKNDRSGESALSVENSEADTSFSTIDVFGLVVPQKVHSVNLDFSCKIKKIFIRDGQIVHKNEKLLELDLDSIHLEINHKEQLYIQCQIDLELLREDYEKNLELISEKTISGQQLKQSHAKYRKKESELKMLEQDYRVAKKMLESIYLNNSVLVCPFDNAVISGFNKNAGNFIAPNSQIMNIIDLDSLVVEANVPEEFINDVSTGAAADIIPLAERQSKYPGNVIYIAHGAKKENGETIVPVIIALSEPDHSLLPYFNVDIKIHKKD